MLTKASSILFKMSNAPQPVSSSNAENITITLVLIDLHWLPIRQLMHQVKISPCVQISPQTIAMLHSGLYSNLYEPMTECHLLIAHSLVQNCSVPRNFICSREFTIFNSCYCLSAFKQFGLILTLHKFWRRGSAVLSARFRLSG